MWRVFSELVENSRLTQETRDRVRAVGVALFRDRFEIDERAMIVAAVTAANLDGYTECAGALLDFAEMRGLDPTFLKGLLDAMPDPDAFNRADQAAIKIATEVTRRAQVRRPTLRFARDFFTPLEIEYLVVLTGFVNFLARLHTIETLAAD